MEQPLSGIRVLELAEGVAGPYAGKLLADYGADVVKVEPPRGDVSRTVGPFPDDRPDPEQSALFLHVNTNKRSAVLDLEQAADRERVADLAAASDVVIESFPPGTLDGWGLGYDALRARHEDVVLTSVTAFGQDGPYAGYAIEDIVAYAMGGPMNVTGVLDREPVQVRGAMVAYQCATVAATATMAAVLVAEAGGGGTHVDVSRYETQAGSIDRRLAAHVTHAYTGGIGARLPAVRQAAAPNGIFPTADGWVQVTTINAWVPRMLKTLGDADLAEAYDDPAYMLDPDLPERLDAVLYPWLLSHTKDECMALAQANGWPVTAIYAPAEVLATPHFVERGLMAEVDHPAAGPVSVLGAPFRMDDGWALRRPAPLLGQHTDEVLADLVGGAGRREG